MKALIEADLGMIEQARASAQEALEFAKAMSNPFGTISALGSLGRLELELEELDLAAGWPGIKDFIAGLSFDNYKILGSDWIYLTSYLRSVVIAALSTFILLLIGYPIAYGIALSPRHRPDGRSFAPFLLGRPGAVPPRTWILNEYHTTRVVRGTRFKLYSDGRLFDAQGDPAETMDLAGSDDQRQAGGWEGRPAGPDRDDQASQRGQAGDLRRSPALHLQR